MASMWPLVIGSIGCGTNMDVDMAPTTYPFRPTFNLGSLFIVKIHPFQNSITSL